MKKNGFLIVLLSISAMSFAQVDLFFSPNGSGSMTGTSWDNAAAGSSANLAPLFYSSQQAIDVTLHFMEGVYPDFELWIEDTSSANYSTISIYGGYSSISTGTDLSLRDVYNCPTIFESVTNPQYSPYATIYISVCDNGVNTIVDGIELDGSNAANNVSAIFTGNAPSYISNCKIYGYGSSNTGSGGSASSMVYSYLLWLEHGPDSNYAFIVDSEIANNHANVLIMFSQLGWIENTLICNNDLETEFIWNQDGDNIDINNIFFNNSVAGNNINGIAYVSRVRGERDISTLSYEEQFSNSVYSENESIDMYLITIDGKLSYYGKVNVGDVLPQIESLTSYFVVLRYQDGRMQKFVTK